MVTKRIIVNFKKEYESLLQRTKQERFVLLPIYSFKTYHPIKNKIMMVMIKFLSDNSLYLVNNLHPDANKFDIENILDTNQIIYVDNKIQFLYHFSNSTNLIDLSSMQYINGESAIDIESPIQKYFSSVFRRVNNRYSFPLTKWFEAGEAYLDKISIADTISETLEFYSNIVAPTLCEIEKSGLQVDEEELKLHFKKYDILDNKVYSLYNPFTRTGRPSNAFNKINFSALNKADGSRKSFVSRFGKKGKLVELDFDAYHLRLIINRIPQISIDETSLHTYLAKEYFGTNEITDSQYQEGKLKTFEILYGDEIPEDAPEILVKLKEMEYSIVREHRKNGYIISPISKIPIKCEEDRSGKIFSYYVQRLEFETTIVKLQNLLKTLSGKQSKLILYTYDSVLLDVLDEELEALMPIVKSVLEEGGYPVKVAMGDDYHNKVSIN